MNNIKKFALMVLASGVVSLALYFLMGFVERTFNLDIDPFLAGFLIGFVTSVAVTEIMEFLNKQ
jgi:hypothetical protein